MTRAGAKTAINDFAYPTFPATTCVMMMSAICEGVPTEFVYRTKGLMIYSFPLDRKSSAHTMYEYEFPGGTITLPIDTRTALRTFHL